MSIAEEEIKIGITTNYDGSGVDKARADLEGLQEESSQPMVSMVIMNTHLVSVWIINHSLGQMEPLTTGLLIILKQ